MENATVGLHCVDAEGIIIWANQTELNLLGYSQDEYFNEHISKFHKDKDVIQDMLTRLTNNESLANYPARLIAKDSSIKHVIINSNVYIKNDKFVHTRCFTFAVDETLYKCVKKTD